MALDDILKDIEERKVANPPVRRNVYVADLNINVNTDLETPDEINYATKTQVLNKPKQEYMGLKECENPFKSVFNASVESMKNVLDKVVPESIRKPAKEWATGAVATGVSLGNLSWGATKIFSSEFAMGSETLKQQRELEQSYMRREINQEEYSAKLKALLSKREKENSLMREDIAQEVKANNDEVNKWIADMGFGPNNDSKASKFFYNLGSANVSMLASLGAFALTKNPMLSIALLSTPEFTSGYLQAIEEGKSADQAMKSGAENFFWTAGTEYIGTKVLFSTLSKSSKLNEGAKRIFANSPRISMTAVAGVEEGTQEAIQSVGTDLIYKFNDISDLKAIDIIKNASNDFLFAFLSGGMVGAVTSNIQYNDILNKTKKELTALKDDKGQKVYTPEQADRVAKQTAQLAMSQNIIDEVTGVSRAERDNSLSKEARNPKTIKQELEDNLKKMEVALPEIKKELMDIKTKVKDNVSGLGLDNEQAEMVAEMTQARAMMYYNAFGITPLQFYYLNELEIRVDENSDILSNGRKTGYTVRFNEEKVSQAISSGNISNIIQSIRTKENLDKFGDFVNKLVNEGRLTQEQRSMIYSQLADRMNEIPTTSQVVDRVREEEVDKFNQPAYHGTPHRFEEFSTEKIGTGEGAQAHGWGLYFAEDIRTGQKYRSRLTGNSLIVLYNGKEVDKQTDEMFRDYISKKKEDGRITLNSWAKDLKQRINNSIELTQNDIEYYTGIVEKLRKNKDKKIEDIDFTEKEKEDVNNVIDGIAQDAMWDDQTEEFEKDRQSNEFVSHIADYIQDVEIEQDKKYLKEEQDKLDKLNKTDLSKIEIKPAGQLFQVEIPESDVLLDEDKTFDEQPKKVQEALKEITEKEFSPEIVTRNDIAMLKYIKKYMEGISGNYNEQDLTHSLWVAMGDYLLYGKEKTIEKIKKEVVSSGQQVRIDFVNSIDNIDRFGTKKPIDFNFKGNNGRRIYNLIASRINGSGNSFRDASLLLNKYGIKGITYDGYQDGRAYVIFDDKAVKVLEKFYQMGGPKAKTAIMRKLEIAQELEQNNVTQEAIWKQTGWLHDIDGKWKFEIDDSKAKLKEKNLNKALTTLENILSHKDLYDAYPELKNMPVHIRNLGTRNYAYITGSGTDIYVNRKMLKEGKLDNFKSVLLHEIQHYIQHEEGFASGGDTRNMRAKRVPRALKDTETKRDILTTFFIEKLKKMDVAERSMNQTYRSYIQEHIKDLKKLKDKELNKKIKDWEEYNKELYVYDNNSKFARYQRLKGETEARNTQTRKDLTPEERRQSLPYETQDYQNDNLIIRLQDGTEIPYTPRQESNNGQNLPANRGEVALSPVDTPVTEQTKSIITVFSGGDRSTIIHEMAHIFLRDIEIIENQGGVQDEQFKKIKKTLDNWLGKKEGQKYTVEQQEKFASGFETYMATGQAPKEELKGVFDYFKKWMSQIYNGIKNMIPITPEVKTMFDEILTLQPTNNAIQTQTEGGGNGGGNIINTPPTQTEGGDIVPVTPDAKDLGKVERKKNTSIIDFTNKFIQPVTTRLGAIDVRLEYEMKMFEARLAMRQTKYKNASLDFLKETDDLQKKNKQDYLNFDRALKNRDINTINRITEKYPKLKTAYEKVRTMLDDIKADLMIYGVGSLENYFPRKIANIDGLISYLEGTENWSEIERAMKQSDKNYKSWSEEKKAEFVASYLQGYRAGVKTSSAHTKQRKVDTINDEMDRYYENSNNALLEYINSISNFIETAKMLKLGKDKVFEMGGITKDGIIDMKQVVNNIESVLGTYVKDLVKNKTITREQEREIAQILKARFNFQNTNNLVSVIKSIGYLTTLGNINSVITQFGDLTYSINNVGVFGTLKAIFGDKKIKMQDIGIDHPAEDFADGIGFTQKLLNAVLTSIGFKYVDSLGKNTYIATTFMKYKKMVEKNEQKAFDDISRRYGEEFAKDLIDDIKNNRLSENVYLFAHSELSRVQPISLSEVPTEYLTHPIGRVFYSLKTFWIKQFNRVITDNKRLIQEGIKEKNNEKIKEGATSMARLILLFVILGSGTDMLKDLIYLRKIDLEDTVFDNFLKILGISRYTMYKGREEGYGRVFLDTIFTVPVVQMLDSFLTELGRAGKGKMKLKDLRIASNIPIIGNPYYWWLGGGRTKEKKKNKRRVL